jgi:outer membrane protein assembly factor BamB
MSQAWSDGFVVFDNGYHHQPAVSRAVEYALDVEARTIERVWSFTSENSTFNPVLGDVLKLENTYLVSWTVEGMLTEITPDGTVVWRASSELGTATGRLFYLPTF